MHPWYDIEAYHDDSSLNVYIEIGQGSKIKYELDKETGILRVDRILSSSVVYVSNYGFIPKTLAEDNDPLDALVYSQASFQPGCIAVGKPIGVLRMRDDGEMDDKIITVHSHDPLWRDTDSLDQLPQHELKEIKQFFTDYKKLENKEVEVMGFEGKDAAMKIIKESQERYEKMIRDKESQKDQE